MSEIAEDVLLRNNVKILGTGNKTIILAHGFGCDQDMWRYIVPSFVDSYQVILFDYVGSGESSINSYDRNKYHSLHGYAQDVLDIADVLGIQNAIFIGHSVSSMIGMLASIQKPELFERLIMLGPSPRYLNDPPDYYGGFDKSDIDELLGMMEMNFIGWASYLAPIVMQNADRKGLTEELEKSFCSRDPHIARQFAEVTFLSDCREYLDAANSPALILQCADDSISLPEVGRYLKAHLKNSELKQLEARGHYPHLSHPEETSQVIKQYLASL